MWQPDPAWQRLPGGLGPATVGVWRAEVGGTPGGRQAAGRPRRPEDPPGAAPPTSPSRGWSTRRRACARRPTAVEEDADGITLVSGRGWTREPANGLFVATCLGRFAGAALGDATLAGRATSSARGSPGSSGPGGWRTLARTPVADVADHLWRHRDERLDDLDALPLVAQHGDPTRAQPARPARRRRGGDRLGQPRPRPGRWRPRLLRALGQGGARAPARGVPRGPTSGPGVRGAGDPGRPARPRSTRR